MNRTSLALLFALILMTTDLAEAQQPSRVTIPARPSSFPASATASIELASAPRCAYPDRATFRTSSTAPSGRVCTEVIYVSGAGSLA